MREVKFLKSVLVSDTGRLDWPCIKIIPRTTASLDAHSAVGKAYFLDASRALLSKLDKIPRARHGDGDYGLPPLMKLHTEMDVYIPIHTAAKEGKWRSMVVVLATHESSRQTLIPSGKA